MAGKRRDIWSELGGFDDERAGDVFEAQRHADAVVQDRQTLRSALAVLGQVDVMLAQVSDALTARARSAGIRLTPAMLDWSGCGDGVEERRLGLRRSLEELRLRQSLDRIEELYGHDLDADELHFRVFVSCLRRRGWIANDIARAVARWDDPQLGRWLRRIQELEQELAPLRESGRATDRARAAKVQAEVDTARVEESEERKRVLHNARRRVKDCIESQKGQDANPAHAKVLKHGIENHRLSEDERGLRLEQVLVEALIRSRGS